MSDDRVHFLPEPDDQQINHFRVILENAQSNLNTTDAAANTGKYVSGIVHYAELLLQAGRLEDARCKAQEAIKLDCSSILAARALLVLAECASHEGAMEQADQYYQAALALAQVHGDSVTRSKVFLEKARMIYLRRGQFDLALTYIDQAETSENNEAYWKSRFLSALINLTIGNRSKTRQALDELLPLVTPGSQIAGAYHFLWACLTLDQEELDKAIEYLQLSFRLASQVGNPDLNAWVRIGSSRYYRLKNAFPAARMWSEDAVNYTRMFGSKFLLGQALVELALVSGCEGNNQAALECLGEALQIFEPIGAKFETTKTNFYKTAFQKQFHHPD